MKKNEMKMKEHSAGEGFPGKSKGIGKKGGRERSVRPYLEEGLVALLPEYNEKGAGSTQILTLQGMYRDCRSQPWLVELLARFYSLDLAAVRRRTGSLLGLRHHIPLPLSEGLVLLPVKVRRAAALGEITTGYVNLLQVKEVGASRQGDKSGGSSAGKAASARQAFASTEGEDSERSCLICRDGLTICCLNTPATLKQKLRQGEMALQDLLQRKKITAATSVSFSGLDGEALRELVPSCRCLLRSLFLWFLDSINPVGRCEKN